MFISNMSKLERVPDPSVADLEDAMAVIDEQAVWETNVIRGTATTEDLMLALEAIRGQMNDLTVDLLPLVTRNVEKQP
jgi:hypothetical protein